MKVIFMSDPLAQLYHISPSPDRPVYVCQGKDCRKERKKIRCLEEMLDGHGEVVQVQCQKICKGPVVGLEVNGQLEWFGKLGDKEARKSLIRLITTGELKNRLSSRIAKKRHGKLRGELPLAAK
jgi:hypothetical protein